MATQVGIRELRDNLTALMRRVRDGETLEVTHHRTPVAVISPVQDDWIAHLVAIGEVTMPTEPWSLPPLHRVTGPMTASEALMEDRDSED